MLRRLALLLSLALPVFLIRPAAAQEVGRVGVDWVGNDIVVEAVPDPGVQGVTCYLSYFDRSIYDRLSQGNWFENPSNSAISCTRTGPVTVGDIRRGPKGEQIFRESRSLILKSLKVTRIFDEANGVLIYLSHANEVTEGSAKMAMSVVPVGP
ncbi:MAG: CreA family protein [Paracoccaceae bacterium]